MILKGKPEHRDSLCILLDGGREGACTYFLVTHSVRKPGHVYQGVEGKVQRKLPTRQDKSNFVVQKGKLEHRDSLCIL